MACPHCGEHIKRRATACRHCGSDARTGWSEDTYLDGIDLPEAEDYGEGLEREGFREPAKTAGRTIVAAVSLILVALFALWLLRGAF